MKTAAAVGVPPHFFWTYTPHELRAAIDGHNLAQGSKDALREEREDDFAAFKVGLAWEGVA